MVMNGDILLSDIYNFFQLEFSQTAIKEYQLLLIVYDPVKEVIVRWIK